MTTTPLDSTTRPDDPITLAKASQYESIVIVGTENHDWHENRVNKAMFMMQGIRRLKLYPKEHKKTVFLFAQEYPADLLAAFKSAVEKHDGAVKTLSSNDELLSELNKRKENIKRIDIYSHGVVHFLLFGLQCSYALQTQFTHGDATKLQKSPYAFNAEIYSYACRTGLGNPAIDQSATVNGKKLDPMEDTSLAQHIADKTRVNTYAYLRRTDYVDTFGSKSDRISWRYWYSEPGTMDRLKSMAEILSPHPRDRADALQTSIFNRAKAGTSYPFDPEGALNDVTPAPTPEGVNAGLSIFPPSERKW
jgi:hypothetical protein